MSDKPQATKAFALSSLTDAALAALVVLPLWCFAWLFAVVCVSLPSAMQPKGQRAFRVLRFVYLPIRILNEHDERYTPEAKSRTQ